MILLVFEGAPSSRLATNTLASRGPKDDPIATLSSGGKLNVESTS